MTSDIEAGAELELPDPAADSQEPVYWFCNSCGEEVDDQFTVCCDDGENEPSWDQP